MSVRVSLASTLIQDLDADLLVTLITPVAGYPAANPYMAGFSPVMNPFLALGRGPFDPLMAWYMAHYGTTGLMPDMGFPVVSGQVLFRISQAEAFANRSLCLAKYPPDNEILKLAWFSADAAALGYALCYVHYHDNAVHLLARALCHRCSANARAHAVCCSCIYQHSVPEAELRPLSSDLDDVCEEPSRGALFVIYHQNLIERGGLCLFAAGWRRGDVHPKRASAGKAGVAAALCSPRLRHGARGAGGAAAAASRAG